jgi:hypothetical protein
MDILGFGDFVESTDIQTVIAKLQSALVIAPVAQLLGSFPKGVETRQFHVTAQDPQLRVFSFSDTFILSSQDDSVSGFFQIIVGTALFSTYLFAAGLPVRGAITCGEAEYIPGTAHLVGRAVIRAARLEKQQDWFGVLLDPEILTEERRQILSLPFVKPLVVDYDVPLKESAEMRNPCTVINWRFNMVVQPGIVSLFRKSEDPAHQKKRDATLKFCRWLRDSGLAYGTLHGTDGKKLGVPWLTGCHVGPKEPGTPGAIHGDEY